MRARRERVARASCGSATEGIQSGTREHAMVEQQLNSEIAGALRARGRHGSAKSYGCLHVMGWMGEGGALPSSPKDTIYGGEGDPRARRRRGALSGALWTERLRWIWWFYSPGSGDERKRETLGGVWTRRGVKRGARATGGARCRCGRDHVRAQHELNEKVRGG